MACKFLFGVIRPWTVLPKMKPAGPRVVLPQTMTVRSAGGLIPPTQYDIPFPKKMRFSDLLSKNWELIPLFAVTGVGISLPGVAVIWSLFNKVDVVFKTHSRDNISRTMNLLSPTTHKVVPSSYYYCKPWISMHNVLDKMKREECKRAEKRKKMCKLSSCKKCL